MPYFDLSMEAYTFFSTIIFFMQWRESLVVYVDKTFLEPLRSKNESEFRHTMAKFDSKNDINTLKQLLMCLCALIHRQACIPNFIDPLIPIS